MNTYVAPESNLPQAAPIPPKVPAGLAIAALVVGVAAFLTGWIPVWGLIAGIAAVLLGIFALVKGQSKGMAIPGLILGAIAALTSLVTTIVMIVGIGSTNVITTTPDSDTPASTNSEPSTGQNQSSDKTGTRENPAPLSSEISSDDWTVMVNSFNPDGNNFVAEANKYNDEPAEGSHYVIVNYTVTYTGSDSASAFEVSVDLVSSAGNVAKSFDNFVVLDDNLGSDELYNGGSATGSEAFLVEDGSSHTIRVTPGFFTDETFVATQ